MTAYWPPQGTTLDCARFFERFVSAVFVDCLKAARSDTNAHKFLQFGHPDPLATQIGHENSRHHFCDVPAYAAFLFGQTTPVNHAPAHGFGSSNAANSRHIRTLEGAPKLPSLRVSVKRIVVAQGMTASQPSMLTDGCPSRRFLVRTAHG